MGNVKRKKKSDSLEIIYCVFPKNFKIEKEAEKLIQKKLIVCLNIIPKVHSIYAWKGKTEKSVEQIVFIKTAKRKVKSLMLELMRIHPYEVPLICVLGAEDSNREYLDYLSNELTT